MNAVDRSTARWPPVRAPSVALFPRLLDRGRRLRRRHAAASDLGSDVVDDAADGGAEALVVEVLVIVRLREIIGDVLHEGIGEAGLGALDDGNQEAAGGELRLGVLR